MTLKDAKIFIPEIAKERIHRMRSGHTNIWEEKDYPTIELLPPTKGLYAERFEDGWYWVCGCHHCLENGEPYSYIVCEEHNRCSSCGTHRDELTEIPWGHAYGFRCRPCQAEHRRRKKEEALAEAKRAKHSKYDCMDRSSVICPVCATDCGSEEIDEDEDMECPVCDAVFSVIIDVEVTYTTRLKEA